MNSKLKTKLNRIISLIKKEFIALLKDPKNRFVLIGPPLLQLFIFSYAVTLEVKNINLAIYDADRSKPSVELVHRIESSSYFTNIVYANSPKQVKNLIDNEKVIAALILNDNFAVDLKKGSSQAQVILDGRNSNSAQIVNGYLTEIINDFSIENSSSVQVSQQKNNQAINPLTTNWYNPNLKYIWFTLPSIIGILAVVITLVITSLSIATEREMGTFDQLLVSPLTPGEIIIGKSMPAIIIGTLEASVMAVLAINIFKIPFTGNILVFIFGVISFVYSVLGIGLFISAISKTQQQAVLGTFVFMVPAITLSGYAAPIENMPLFFQKITYINPLRYFLILVKGVFLKELSLSMSLEFIFPLLIIGTAALTIASQYFKRKLD
jgi:ABC-2 type transport system permease protein